MTTPTIDLSFSRQYESEVHEAYQRQGSMLRMTVRNKSNVRGKSTTFQRTDKGTAGTKSRHGLVPVMNVDHTPIECVLEDHYAGFYVDRLDELKIEHDERRVVVNAGAWALGRKTDELIITAASGATQQAMDGTTGLTKLKVLEGFKILNTADVPDDGMRYGIVTPQGWNDLLNIVEFASSDFVGPDELPWKGAEMKRWLGIIWMKFTGLPIAGGVGTGFLWHKSAIGHASGHDVSATMSWENTRAAHFFNHMMSQGTCLIDPTGIVKLPIKE